MVTTNRVMVDKPLSVRSVNGPQFTVIQGLNQGHFLSNETQVRCVYLTSGASLSGFTITNGLRDFRWVLEFAVSRPPKWFPTA